MALLHDLCKIGCYKPGFRNVKDERGVWQKVASYSFEDPFPFGHGEKSVWMVMKYMKLTDHEAFAIRYHMGFSGEEDNRNVGQAMAKFPLAFALSVADSAADLPVDLEPGARAMLAERIEAHPEWFGGTAGAAGSASFAGAAGSAVSRGMRGRNELTIFGADGSRNRPDRVVYSPDGGVVIIDYKFGAERDSYLRQVRR